MRNMFSVDGNFDDKGFLALGFAGHQPDLANYYTNNGSLYMTSLVFLPLGLPADHPFGVIRPRNGHLKRHGREKLFQLMDTSH